MRNTFIDEIVVADASAEDCFAIITDVAHWKDWGPVKSARQISRGEFRRGTLFFFAPVVRRLPPAPLLVSVLDCEPNRKVAWGLRIGKVEFIHQLTFSPLPDGRTEIHHSEWCTHLLAPMTRPLNGLLYEFNSSFSRALCARARR